MSFWNTYLLITPYLSLIVYFLIFQRDNFFLKTRSSVQLLFVFIALTMIIVQLASWKLLFYDYSFFKFNIIEEEGKNKIIPLITIIAAIGATIGWVFTSRVQIINAIKGHTMQVLMSSRTSTIYSEKVDEAMKLKKILEKELKDAGKEGETVKLTKERYLELNAEQRSAVHYLLNFLEFVAVGIRHYTLDEEFIRGSLRSILNSNYRLFHPVIEHLRVIDNHTVYTQIELLHKRWDEAHHEKCKKCNEWYKLADTKINWNTKYGLYIHLVMALASCGIWLMVVLGMWVLGKLTDRQFAKNTYTCGTCEEAT